MFERRSYLEALCGGGVRRRRPILLACASALSVFAAGCGNQYRPVVSAINPVGPAPQPTKYAIAISTPSASSAGLLTFVDFAGDTVLSTPQVLSNPVWLTLGQQGTEGYVINSAGSFDEFPTGSPTRLISSEISQSTLSAGSSPVSISSFTLTGGTTAAVYVPEPVLSQVAALTGTGSLFENIGVPNNPVYVVGTDGARRGYVISEGDKVTPSTVSSIESGNLAVSSTIPVGIDPVYGVMTADGTRAFILNKGSGTVNVINVINNGKDLNSSLGPNSTIAVGASPVWADLSPLTNQLVVLNQGDGVHAGSLSIINIPLCSVASPAGNPTCDPANPTDAVGFGTVLATVPVGVNPVMVSVLADGSKAYVANAGNVAAGVQGSVSVVNLVSGTVTATIPGATAAIPTQKPACPAGASGCLFGHPNTIAATTGTPTGKVYVTSGDSNYMTVIETDTDKVVTNVNLQGAGVKVVLTSP